MSSPNPDPPKPRAILVRLPDELHADVEEYAKDCDRAVHEVVQDILVEALQTTIDNWRMP